MRDFVRTIKFPPSLQLLNHLKLVEQPSELSKNSFVDKFVVEDVPDVLYNDRSNINAKAFIIGANTRDGIIPFVVPKSPKTSSEAFTLLELSRKKH